MQGIEKRTFYRYCRNSLYNNQLNWFLKYWSKSELCVINQVDLLLNPKQTMFKILTHIGVEKDEFFQDFKIISEKVVGEKSLELDSTKSFKKYNSLDYEHSLSDELETTLKNFFKDDIKSISSEFDIEFNWIQKYLT